MGNVLWRVCAVSLFAAGVANAQPGNVAPQPVIEPAPPEAPVVERRPSDERLFLVPTALTMRRGTFVLEDDEGVTARMAIGIARRVQLDMRIGGILIPGAAGGALALPGGIAAGGGAGFVLMGLFDVGAKVAVLDETKSAPGVAVSYDMVDVFGLAAGGAGILLVGAGAVGGGVVAVGGANVQLNLVSVTAGKHWGRTELVAGSYFLDNHHYLPQSAGFVAACGAGGAGEAGAGGVVAPCAGNSKPIERLPFQVQPYLGIERGIFRDSSLSAEVLFSSHLANTVGATGVRWFIYQKGPVRVRLDIALLWSHVGYPLPWAGVGIHFR